ncbi:MAG: hypothetical protein K8T89_24140 [Planctomycetes bacterium]|nr:hypothetical protein [Planctomycetota bacterium]
MGDFSTRYAEDELIAIVAKLFPQGFAGADVRRTLAPEGWDKSPLLALFHPSPEQRFQEALRMHENMEAMRLARGKELPPEPPPTLADFVDDSDDVIAPDEEISRLVGMCLWDIFSDSHDVLDEGGREISLGSFRASAGFLADRLNEQVKNGQVQGPAIDAATRAEEVHKAMRAAMPQMNNDLLFQFMKEQQTGPYDYMDFYLGTQSIAHRADLGPVYRMIFTRLKALDLDWKYTFPRLHLVDMRPLKEQLDAQKAEESGEPDWAGYSPEKELADDETNREKDRELAEMRESLDEGYRESVAAALNGPPPLIVESYQKIFGDWPTGWPPTA